MKNRVNGILFSAMVALAGAAMLIKPVQAHSFNVSLLIPPSKAGAPSGDQILRGFMLATKERDGHPDQESDGHLGGLDVYVTVVDGQADTLSDLRRIAPKGDPDIVVAFDDGIPDTVVDRFVSTDDIALLRPGRTPFSKPGLPGTRKFMSDYQREYGVQPSASSAQGYNAGRRIESAVRAQSGVRDKASLLQNFKTTADNFDW